MKGGGGKFVPQFDAGALYVYVFSARSSIWLYRHRSEFYKYALALFKEAVERNDENISQGDHKTA